MLQRKTKYYADVIRSNNQHTASNIIRNDLMNAEMNQLILKMYEQIGRFTAVQQTRLYREEKSSVMALETKAIDWAALVADYLKKYLFDKITFAINETLRNRVLQIITTGYLAGTSADVMAKQIESPDFTLYQAARIVRTEVHRAAQTGQQVAADNWPYEQTKKWISAKDNRVRGIKPKDRADHINLSGITIDEEDYFFDSRSGDYLKFPGDPNASAATTINCRCAVVRRSKRDENGRLIPKKNNSRIYVESPRNRTIQTVTI